MTIPSSDIPDDVPDADALEQAAEPPAEAPAPLDALAPLDTEADEADLAEQALEVPLGDRDEYA
jgi:hypothetical protein